MWASGQLLRQSRGRARRRWVGLSFVLGIGAVLLAIVMAGLHDLGPDAFKTCTTRRRDQTIDESQLLGEESKGWSRGLHAITSFSWCTSSVCWMCGACAVVTAAAAACGAQLN
eukprot:SAG25_NODE_2793_length_1382_cov_1.253313_2_plen_113_part_00